MSDPSCKEKRGRCLSKILRVKLCITAMQERAGMVKRHEYHYKTT